MDIAQKKLSKYKKENNLVDTGNVKKLKINEIESISARIIEAKSKYQKQQNDLLSIKVADGDVDALMSVAGLRSAEQISNVKNSLDANESNIQSLLLIYTDKHPKIVQAKELNIKFRKSIKKYIR